jgi:hypothetical protein
MGRLWNYDRTCGSQLRISYLIDSNPPIQQHSGQGFGCNLKGAQARRVIEDLRGDHQLIRTGLLDEIVQIRAHHLGSADRSARQYLIEDGPFLRPEALDVAFDGRLQLRRTTAA